MLVGYEVNLSVFPYGKIINLLYYQQIRCLLFCVVSALVSCMHHKNYRSWSMKGNELNNIHCLSSSLCTLRLARRFHYFLSLYSRWNFGGLPLVYSLLSMTTFLEKHFVVWDTLVWLHLDLSTLEPSLKSLRTSFTYLIGQLRLLDFNFLLAWRTCTTRTIHKLMILS